MSGNHSGDKINTVFQDLQYITSISFLITHASGACSKTAAMIFEVIDEFSQYF